MLLFTQEEVGEMLDEQFDKAWEAGIECAFITVKDVLGSGPALDEIKRRLIEELEMKERE